MGKKQRKKKNNTSTQFSSLPSQMRPRTIHNVTDPLNMYETTWEEFSKDLNSLIACVRTQAMTLYEDNTEYLHTVTREYEAYPAPAEYARQCGINYHADSLPARVKQKYRVNKLIGYKLIAETASYTQQPDENKQTHTFSTSINLGAVDKQMCTLSWDQDENMLVLEWVCWFNVYLLTFPLPEYVRSQRDVAKWCLPVVSPEGFTWTYEENTRQVPDEPARYAAATDFGRVEPYKTIVVNTRGKVVAELVPSGRLSQVNKKRERVLAHKRDNTKRLSEYERRDPEHSDPVLQEKADVLRRENKRLGAKASRQLGWVANQTGHEIGAQLARHRVAEHYTEGLGWAVGPKYGSKWGHSRLFQATQHNLTRRGIKHEPVSARNNSQDCIVCETQVVHNSKTRVAYCPECYEKMDRERLACLNMLKKANWLPVPVRWNEPVPQVSTERENSPVTSIRFNSS